MINEKTKDVKWFTLLISVRKYLYTNISDSDSRIHLQE